MSPGNLNDCLEMDVRCLPIDAALANLNITDRGVGSDGYLITPAAARKLLEATAHDLYFGHIDWRLVRYSVTSSLLEENFKDTRIYHIVINHHNHLIPPVWGILRSYCLNTPLVSFSYGGPFASRISGPAA